MADEAPVADKAPVSRSVDAAPAPPPAERAPAEAPRRFRVMCGAVSGLGRNSKGESIPADFHRGAVVTEQQLGGGAAAYMLRGSIVEVG